MDAESRTRLLSAASEAVAERQLNALRRWLGEDHELIRLHAPGLVTPREPRDEAAARPPWPSPGHAGE